MPSVLGNYSDLIYFLTLFIPYHLDQHLPYFSGKVENQTAAFSPLFFFLFPPSFSFFFLHTVQTACSTRRDSMGDLCVTSVPSISFSFLSY